MGVRFALNRLSDSVLKNDPYRHPGWRSEPECVVLDVADLGAIYLGGIRPGELAAVGRIEERTAGAVRRLTALFASDVTPWCTTMF